MIDRVSMVKLSLSPDQFYELLLSHHPDCECFKDDVVVILGRRVCAGCLTAYPLAILTFILFLPIGPASIYYAIVLAVFSMSRKLIRSTKIKLLLRCVAGIALGFGIGGLVWAIMHRDIFLLCLLLLGTFFYAGVRAYSLNGKLAACRCADKRP